MTADRWALVESVFLAALEQPDDRRGAFLDQACADDHALRGEVDSLLRHAGRSGGVLSAPAAQWAREIAAAHLPAGRQMGPYVIEGLAGAGGMGEVYRARDLRLDRPVALKLLPEALARDPQWALRFEREARALGALNHPNIVTVHDLGETDGRPWMATEFVAGVTLRERMAQGRLRAADTLALIRQVLAGLAAAHDAGVVHRDVKPENIMVRSDGVVKLLDFGLARPLGPDARITADGARLGTLRYMSPEQLAGEDVGRPSDVWSAGVVLFEMVTGAVVPEPSSRRPEGLPFEDVLARALARAPAARYQSAGEMLAALAQSRPYRWRRPSWWLAAGIVALTGMAALAVRWRHVEREPFTKTQVRRLATLPRVLHAALSPDGGFLAYTDERSGAYTLWLQQMNGSPPRAVPADAPYGFSGVSFSRDGYLYYVAHDASRLGQLHRLALVGGDARPILRDVDSPPAFTPDGLRFAFLRNDNRRGVTSLVVAGVDGAGERVVAEREVPLGFTLMAGCAWSPDARKILAAANVRDADGVTRAALLEVDAATGATQERGARRWSWIGSLAAAGPRGLVFPAVVIGSQTAQIVLLSWSGHESAIDTATAQGGFLEVSATADGQEILAIHRDREASLMVAPRDRMDAPRRVPAASGAFYDPAFGPPPYLLAHLFTGVRPGLVRIARDGSFEPLLTRDLLARHPATAPGGDVVFVAARDGVEQVWRVDAAGNGVRLLTDGRARATSPTCCTPDGRVVYLAEGAGYPALWSVSLRDGGAAPLSTRPALKPALDATGTRLAWVDLDAPDAAAQKVVVAPVDALDRRTPVPAVAAEALFRWSPGSQALTFLRTAEGVSNLWEAPLDGGPARQLTRFTEQTIFGFDWSRDGREAVILRGNASSHLLLITERGE